MLSLPPVTFSSALGAHSPTADPFLMTAAPGFPSHIFATQERLSSSLVSPEDLREGPRPVPNLQQSWRVGGRPR